MRPTGYRGGLGSPLIPSQAVLRSLTARLLMVRARAAGGSPRSASNTRTAMHTLSDSTVNCITTRPVFDKSISRHCSGWCLDKFQGARRTAPCGASLEEFPCPYLRTFDSS